MVFVCFPPCFICPFLKCWLAAPPTFVILFFLLIAPPAPFTEQDQPLHHHSHEGSVPWRPLFRPHGRSQTQVGPWRSSGPDLPGEEVKPEIWVCVTLIPQRELVLDQGVYSLEFFFQYILFFSSFFLLYTRMEKGAKCSGGSRPI